VIYGQCYELCGINHAYMPIEIRVVTRAEFEQWVAAQGGSMATAAAPAEGEQAPPGEAAPAAQEPAAPAAQPTR
jgi:cytochrome c oxidase subunit 2